MSLLAIRKYGDPILREKCLPVKKVDDSIRQLMHNMAQTMHEYGGAGLAASQVGVKKRVIIIASSNGLIALANPEITSGGGKETAVEGCLSLPGIEVGISRAKEVTVEGLDREGKNVKLKAEGIPARAVQHEIDHLNGILIIDYMSLVKKHLAKKKLQGIKKIWDLRPVREGNYACRGDG